MDETKFSGLLSQIIPDEIGKSLGLGGENAGKQNSRAFELLKNVAGQAGGGVENELNDFLNGRGALLETTRAAVARGGTSTTGRKTAANEVSAFLTNQLHFSALIAELIAPLVIQIFPAIGNLAGSGTASKPKPRRKKKEDSSSAPSHSHRPRPSSSTKPAASHKPRKPKNSSSSKPKPSATRPRKRPKRTLEIDTGQEA